MNNFGCKSEKARKGKCEKLPHSKVFNNSHRFFNIANTKKGVCNMQKQFT